TGLIALVFVFALSMFGIFEIQLGGGTTTQLDALARRDGYGGAFMHGMFTTLLGTSCTAPFLGSALGVAFVQPAPIVFAIFTAIAAGMSLPYFLLTWKPAWMRFLPRPGAWMERLKQFMGFLLLAVVVWLLGVLGQSRGTDALVAVISFLLALGLASWMLGSFQRSVVTWLLIVAVLTASWFVFVQEKLTTGTKVETELKQAGGIPWEVFTPERVEEAVRKGQPVFIDFTAEWCLNCKYNEKAVLETDKVRAAIAEKGVLPLKGDWTNADPVITEWLKKFGRIGVPVYVLYTPGKKEPFVFPEILTQAMVLEQLAGIQ
ncbi:MAG TPA: thioredoxin family protein, partial [Chthoniobacteraceae bacterium]